MRIIFIHETLGTKGVLLHRSRLRASSPAAYRDVYAGILLQKELHECVQHIQDPPKLRAHVTAMYKSNVDVDLPRNEMDTNVIHEYHRHKVSPLPRSLLWSGMDLKNYLPSHDR